MRAAGNQQAVLMTIMKYLLGNVEDLDMRC